MNDQKGKRGEREEDGRSLCLTRYWARYRCWLAGLDRGRRIRYRVFQAAVVIAVMILVAAAFLRTWIKVPDLPGPPDPGYGDQSGGEDISSGVSLDLGELPDIANSGRREGTYTFLLAGRDVVSGGTDTMLLLTYDINEKTIRGLNLPRDTMVNTSAASKRLNSVYNRSRGSKDLSEEERVAQGMEGLKKEVANLTGILPDFYVLVEWEAVGELVDALGGVEFEVPFDMHYDDDTPGQDLHIHQEAGLRMLTGDDAMQVIRWRKNNPGVSSVSGNDLVRLSIQQDFLKAVVKKCLQPAIFLKIPSLVQIFTENVATDLTVGNILAFAQLAKGMDPDTGVSFSTAPVADSFSYKGAALITLDAAGILELVNNGLNPYLREIRESDLKVVVHNRDGSFYVTNGTLADPAMGKSQTTTPSKPAGDGEEPPESGETTGPDGGGQTGPEDGDGGQSGDLPQISGDDPVQTQEPDGGGETGQTVEGKLPGEEASSPDGGPIVVIDPEQVLPDPKVNAPQDGEEETDEGGNSVAVLPSRPEPLGRAA